MVSNILYYQDIFIITKKTLKNTMNSLKVMKMSEETTTLTNTELVIDS